MSQDYYKLGDWNALCEVCGQKFKASELRKRWDGAWVCQRDWEPRHPQDFVKGVKDNQSVPWARPDNQNTNPTYVAVNWTQYPSETLAFTQDQLTKTITKVIAETITYAESTVVKKGGVGDITDSLSMSEVLTITVHKSRAINSYIINGQVGG